jgi:hypothetical protein
VRDASIERWQLERQAAELLTQASSFVVTDQESLDKAEELLTGVIRPLRRQNTELFKPVIAAAVKAQEDALRERSQIEKPLVEAEVRLRLAIKRFSDEQELAA